MRFFRLYSNNYASVYDQIKWHKVPSKIVEADGTVKFEMPEVEVPVWWSQNATDILAQKYFRKAGVPLGSLDAGREEAGLPAWLWPRQEDPGIPTGSETSAHQVFHRLAGCWTYWGWHEGLITGHEQARIFYDELYMMLALQIAAPNSPQWFNTGLHWAYGIKGPDSGQWIVKKSRSAREPTVEKTPFSYVNPQPHACFIQPVNDDLVNEGGIMDLWVREARLFKHGSGTGTNFSTLRGKGERLSGGGVSSGLMSFLKIGDAAAGAIQSGGTTRRAAKMVIVDVDHPEIEDFVDWKMNEERKALAMSIGSAQLAQTDGGEIYSVEYEGEAIKTVGGQNSNNSVRVTNKFMEGTSKRTSYPIDLLARSDRNTVKQISSHDLWNKICYAAHKCADPGLQFHDTINVWHTCSADGQINASNPCSEYMFLDNTACNLASLNLVAFLDPLTNRLKHKEFCHAAELWTVVLEISVHMASFPSEAIALGSYNYRTLGLGHANAGGLLMRSGLAYDSANGRNYIAAITALMTGMSYLTSSKMAAELGPFPRFDANKQSMLAVIDKHHNALLQLEFTDFSTHVITEARAVWSQISKKKHIEFRNAQTTLLAPTGTIGFVMDCDTTGIEPDYSLKKTKKLAGGGVISIANASVRPALTNLGYTDSQVKEVEAWILNAGTLENMPPRNGQPFVEKDHLSIFDCANPVIPNGRFIRPMAHVEMVAAVQPFLSGAVSKTVNMPADATIKDVSDVYIQSWKLGLKAVSLYRDGSKLSQPLSSTGTEKGRWAAEDAGLKPMIEHTEFARQIYKQPLADVMREWVEKPTPLARGNRETLPSRRPGFNEKAKIDGHSLYLKTGEYPDGRLAEIFISLSREGSTIRSVMECFSKAVSIGLQYGVPLEEYVEAFIFTKFEPAGLVEGPEHIKLCSSIMDYVFRAIGITYLNRMDLSNISKATQIRELLGSVSAIPAAPTLKTGETCPSCGAMMIRDGTCLRCSECTYQNGGCG